MMPDFPKPEEKGFTLIEVVIALGICSFALVAIFGMFSIGVQSVGQASGEFQAANLASLIVSQRRAAPTDAGLSLALPPVNQPLTEWQETNVGWDGLPSNDPGAPYRLRYRAGLTNPGIPGSSGTNSKIALVCLSLTWPAAASATNAAVSHYELVTQIFVP